MYHGAVINNRDNCLDFTVTNASRSLAEMS